MITLDGITFECGIHCIRGRIGSGKSTLARRLRHEAEFSGQRRVLLFQEIEYQITEDTIGKELTSWGVSGTEESFSLFGMPDKNRDPYTLSRGELKRFLLSCILETNADCLILDEPYASLDAEGKEILTGLLRKRIGVTILFSHEEQIPEAALWNLQEGRLCRM